MFTFLSNLVAGWQTNLVKIVAILCAFAFVGLGIFITVKVHDKQIQNATLAKSENETLQTILQEQKVLSEKQEILNKIQSNLEKELNQTKLESALKEHDFNAYITNPDTIKLNRDASKIFKDTLKKLVE